MQGSIPRANETRSVARCGKAYATITAPRRQQRWTRPARQHQQQRLAARSHPAARRALLRRRQRTARQRTGGALAAIARVRVQCTHAVPHALAAAGGRGGHTQRLVAAWPCCGCGARAPCACLCTRARSRTAPVPAALHHSCLATRTLRASVPAARSLSSRRARVW